MAKNIYSMKQPQKNQVHAENTENQEGQKERSQNTDASRKSPTSTTALSYSRESSQQGVSRAASIRSKVDLRKIDFDPGARALGQTWSSHAQTICCVNSYPNGITMSVHRGETAMSEGEEGTKESSGYLPNQFHLRLRDTRDYQLPVGKYCLYRDNYAQALEQQLSQLHKDGELASTVFYFGTTADPFLSFQKKFDVTMACLELFEQYRPGFVVVQTRSPMVISALPILKMLGEKVAVTIPIETPLEQVIAKYSPGQPRISERIIAANGLRRQDICVNLSASPVLPYGDFHRDAWNFAELLENHADYITFGSLASGTQGEEAQLKNLPLAQRLASEKKFQWLRPYSYRNIYYALTLTAPEKLSLPVQMPRQSSQLSMFAA